MPEKHSRMTGIKGFSTKMLPLEEIDTKKNLMIEIICNKEKLKKKNLFCKERPKSFFKFHFAAVWSMGRADGSTSLIAESSNSKSNVFTHNPPVMPQFSVGA